MKPKVGFFGLVCIALGLLILSQNPGGGGGPELAAQQVSVYDTPPVGETRTCKASLFGGPDDNTVGDHTADGDDFDWHADLVAHRTLPYGSLVTISYGGVTVTGVPVKDNGPASWLSDRCIDLSYGLFKKLANPSRGLIVVTFMVTKLNGPYRPMVV